MSTSKSPKDLEIPPMTTSLPFNMFLPASLAELYAGLYGTAIPCRPISQ
ncbi:MAG: hypothetical protein FWC17_00535 [Treponema sp.]|nr:hypothetical protein [Treponema sp.]